MRKYFVKLNRPIALFICAMIVVLNFGAVFVSAEASQQNIPEGNSMYSGIDSATGRPDAIGDDDKDGNEGDAREGGDSEFGGEPEIGGQPEIGGEPEIGGQPGEGGEPEIGGQPGEGGNDQIGEGGDGQPGEGGESEIGGQPGEGGQPGGDGQPGEGGNDQIGEGGEPEIGGQPDRSPYWNYDKNLPQWYPNNPWGFNEEGWYLYWRWYVIFYRLTPNDWKVWNPTGWLPGGDNPGDDPGVEPGDEPDPAEEVPEAPAWWPEGYDWTEWYWRWKFKYPDWDPSTGQMPPDIDPSDYPGGENPGWNPGGENPGDEPDPAEEVPEAPAWWPEGYDWTEWYWHWRHKYPDWDPSTGQMPPNWEPGDYPGGENPGWNPGGENPGENPGGENPGEDPGENPENPTVPADPTKPVDPVEPGDKPEDPTKPVDPVEPGDKPEEPTKPVDPVEPGDKPEDSTKPVDPVEPGNKPAEPTKPVDPVEPGNKPEKPEPPAPVEPEKPAEKPEPEVPAEEPEKPGEDIGEELEEDYCCPDGKHQYEEIKWIVVVSEDDTESEYPPGTILEESIHWVCSLCGDLVIDPYDMWEEEDITDIGEPAYEEPEFEDDDRGVVLPGEGDFEAPEIAEGISEDPDFEGGSEVPDLPSDASEEPEYEVVVEGRDSEGASEDTEDNTEVKGESAGPTVNTTEIRTQSSIPSTANPSAQPVVPASYALTPVNAEPTNPAVEPVAPAAQTPDAAKDQPKTEPKPTEDLSDTQVSTGSDQMPLTDMLRGNTTAEERGDVLLKIAAAGAAFTVVSAGLYLAVIKAMK